MTCVSCNASHAVRTRGQCNATRSLDAKGRVCRGGNPGAEAAVLPTCTVFSRAEQHIRFVSEPSGMRGRQKPVETIQQASHADWMR